MKIFDLNKKTVIAPDDLQELLGIKCLVMCRASELTQLNKVFNFNESTIVDCMDYDENNRFTSFKDYDFVSFMYFLLEDESVVTHEMNVFVGNNYLVLVMPDRELAIWSSMDRFLISKMLEAEDSTISRMYYCIFDKVLLDFSATLETLEDEIQLFEKNMVQKVSATFLEEIYRLKEIVYTVKKTLRAFLYIGDQFIVNDNNLIPPENIRYFKNLDIRINKLYDFGNNLQDFLNQIMNLYENKIAMQTNDTITKLTVITIFFGPPTVIAGIYGMNFTHMPELQSRFGYPLVILGMVIISLAIYAVIKIKKWM